MDPRLLVHILFASLLHSTVIQPCLALHSIQGSPKCHSIGVSDPTATVETHSMMCTSRRSFFNDAVAGFVFPAVSCLIAPRVSNAASPVTARETDSLGAMAKRAIRPKPPKLLRRKLSMDFAVLLMRSSYSALDKLDCVAMDQFQRDFFLIRRSEYEPYIGALGPGVVQQGDLTDPNYFDFISFAQYRTINREITLDPPFVFEEQQPIDKGDDQPNEFVSVIVRRDPAMTNELLGPEHSRLVGSAILDKLDDIFGGTDSAIPKIAPGSRPTYDTVLAALKQLVNLFLINGYAYSGNVAMSAKKMGAFQISLASPATLWGGKILQAEGEKLSNDFVLKAAMELIARAGYRASSSVEFDGSNEEISIFIF